VYGDNQTLQTDPNWRDLIPFHEYFHAENGRGLGASHQTGWTALVAKLMQQYGEPSSTVKNNVKKVASAEVGKGQK